MYCIWNHPWPFIYEHHNRAPMLLSVTFDEIATLVWNLYWAHTFVARWIRYSCVYFYLWPFRFVAVSVCSRSGLWPFRSVAVSVCGRSGLWPFRFVAVSVCGRFGLWPFRFVAVSVCGRLGFGRFGLWPLWPESSQVSGKYTSVDVNKLENGVNYTPLPSHFQHFITALFSHRMLSWCCLNRVKEWNNPHMLFCWFDLRETANKMNPHN